MPLTQRELLDLEEHLKLQQLMIKQLSFCATACNDPQLQAMCQNMVDKHPRAYNTMAKYLNPNLQ